MSEYRAPLTDMKFVLNNVAGLEDILSLDAYFGMDEELVSAILEESSKFTFRNTCTVEPGRRRTRISLQ